MLFTSVGRRVELISAFRRAAERKGFRITICGADIVNDAPALAFCDRTFIVPRISDPEYIPALLELCRNEGINALIPTIDTDLLLISENREEFMSVGTAAIISDTDKVRLCRDKRITSRYFESCGLKSPKAFSDYTAYTGGFPCFIKPKDGSSSINAYKANNPDELESYANHIPGYVIQPYISGKEYTVDIFCDFNGNPIYITPRERLQVRSGEVLKTRIVQDEKIKEECIRLIADFRPRGAITVQLIRDESTGEDYYIEINPRFGGGAPLSIRAGADSSEAMLCLLAGDKLLYLDNAANEETYTRFDESVRVTDGKFALNSLKAVIFDLDDTLYSERDYVKSGFRAVSQLFADSEKVFEKMYEAFEAGKPAFDTFLNDSGIFTEEIKQKCISVYRAHKPDIRLREGARELIERLRKTGVKIGIITDGNPARQQKKLEALGLVALTDEIIVTDSIGGELFRKPNDISFRIMQRRLGVAFEKMMYVGDNPSKDFLAPKQLGMKTCMIDNPDGLYRDNPLTATDLHLKSLSELNEAFRNE